MGKQGLHHVTGIGEALATPAAVPLPDGAPAPEWVQLFGYGVSRGRDGRGPYVVRDQAHGQAIVASTTAYQAGADAPIDYDHQTQRATENGQPVPAVGWFDRFEVRPDGVYGHAAWRDVLKALQGRFILSLNDRPEVRALFADFTLTVVSTIYSVRGKGASTQAVELIITGP